MSQVITSTKALICVTSVVSAFCWGSHLCPKHRDQGSRLSGNPAAAGMHCNGALPFDCCLCRGIQVYLCSSLNCTLTLAPIYYVEESAIKLGHSLACRNSMNLNAFRQSLWRHGWDPIKSIRLCLLFSKCFCWGTFQWTVRQDLFCSDAICDFMRTCTSSRLGILQMEALVCHVYP